MRIASLALFTLIVGCDAAPSTNRLRLDSDVKSSEFFDAVRPVAPIVSSRWSTEEARDRVRESDTVMDLAGINPGMTVADIGAGEGYYTVRLAQRVGASGRVLAQDIVPQVITRLGQRVTRERLANVSVKLGKTADPMLPKNSFDRVFLVHMYHEIGKPYEFLWRLRPSLRIGGRVIVVDANRPTDKHGTPPALLDCEMKSVGYMRVDYQDLAAAGGYLAAFEASGNRPLPDQIKPCALK
jgi:cyclopropane fatty-acyl-phospholipid synthase-like methyltransferase